MLGHPKLTDPVCGHKVNNIQDYISFYQNKEYYFCSRKCLDKFNNNPERYSKIASENLLIKKKVTSLLNYPLDKNNIYSVSFIVTDLDYTSYIHVIEKIEKLRGIESIEINPFTGNISVEYNAEFSSVEEIKNVILYLGFNIAENNIVDDNEIIILKNKLAISIISSIIIFIFNIDYLRDLLPDTIKSNIFDWLFVSFTQIFCSYELYRQGFYYLKRRIFSYHLLGLFFILYLYIYSVIEVFYPGITLGKKTYFTEFSILISIILSERLLFLIIRKRFIEQYNKLKKNIDFAKYEKIFNSNISINTRLFQRNRNILRYYPTFILLTSTITFLFWLIYDRDSGIGEALILSVSPIMINTPLMMSLSLTLPFSNFFLYSGLKKKFFYKNSKALESLDKTDTLIFDKSAVIVDLIPMVTDIFTFNDFDGNTVLKIAASIENQLDNNISRAIVIEAKNRNFDLYTPSSFNHIIGAGIEAKVLTYQVFIGSKEFMKMKNIDTLHMERIANKVASDLKTPIFIAIDNKPAGIIATLNIIKKDAINMSEELKKINITPVLITGDSLKSGISYGESLGIDQKNIFADCMPSKKLKVIEDLKKKSHKVAILKNDNESNYHQLQEDIVISIDNKNIYDFYSDVSIHNSDLNTLKEPFIHAANIMRKTRQNVFWTYIYLTTGLLFAYGLFIELVGIRPSPIFFGILTIISVVLIYFNSLDKESM